MPTIQELKALYQKDASPTNMDPTFKTTGVWVWSGQTGGTSSPGYPGAWGFYFIRGQENRYLLVEAVGYRAFAVRSQSAVTRVPVKTRFTKAQDGVILDYAPGIDGN